MAESDNDNVDIPHDIIIMSKRQFCKKCGKAGIALSTSCTIHSEQYLAETKKMEMQEKIEMAKLSAQGKSLNTIALYSGNAE